MQQEDKGHHEKSQYIQERIYFSLIQKVGSWNRYQFISFCIFSSIYIMEISLIFIAPYLFHQSSYSCENMLSQVCRSYVCSLEQSHRSAFQIQSPFVSLADDIGDFRCTDQSTLKFLQSLLFVGTVSGLIMVCFTVEKLGQKKLILISLVLMLIGLTFILLGRQVWIIAVSIIFILSGAQIQQNMCNYFATQIVAQTKRVFFSTSLYIFLGLGMSLNPLTFYLLKDWKLVFIFIYLIPVIILFICIQFIIQKAPMDLIKNQKPQYILQSLQKIQKINNLNESKLSIIEIEQLCVFYKNKQSQNNKLFTIIDVFNYSSLRYIFIPLSITMFVNQYLFLSPSIINSKNDQKLYISSIISSSSYVIAVPIVYCLLSLIKRKITIILMFIFSIMISSCLMIDAIKNNEATHNAFLFIFRLSNSIQNQIVFFIVFQTYPTQIRAISGVFTIATAQIAGIFLPWIAKFCEDNQINVQFSFILMALIGILSTCFMKQTLNIPPPEIIQQLIEDQQINVEINDL